MVNIAIFISGSGSLLPGFFTLEKTDPRLNVSCVVADRECEGIKRAEAEGKEVLVYNKFDQYLLDYLGKNNVELICLAGFLKIIPADFIEQFPGKIINTHPSLLPKFGGPGMHGSHVHQAVKAAGELITGFTVHEVTPVIDAGPIIAQKQVAIAESDSWQTIEAKVKKLEQEYYPQITADLLTSDGNQLR